VPVAAVAALPVDDAWKWAAAAEYQPGQLDHDVAEAPVAGLGDALLAINRPAAPRGRHQPRIGGHLTSVGKAPVETFKIEHRGNLRADRLEPREQRDRRLVPLCVQLDGGIAFHLDLGNLPYQQLDQLDLTQQLRLQSHG
jgi:hypothetical protein